MLCTLDPIEDANEIGKFYRWTFAMVHCTMATIWGGEEGGLSLFSTHQLLQPRLVSPLYIMKHLVSVTRRSQLLMLNTGEEKCERTGCKSANQLHLANAR